MVKWRLYVEGWEGEQPVHLGWKISEHEKMLTLFSELRTAFDDPKLVRVTVTKVGAD